MMYAKNAKFYDELFFYKIQIICMLTFVFFYLQKVNNEMDVMKAKRFQQFFDIFFLACKIPDFYVEPLISEFLSFKKKYVLFLF